LPRIALAAILGRPRYLVLLKGVQQMTARAFRFWTRWLMVVSLAMSVFGVALVLFDTRLLPGFSTWFSLSMWGTPVIPDSALRYHQFANAVLGSVMSAWGVLLAFVVRHAFASGQRWAWNAIALAVAVWFIADSGVSAYLNVWPNVVLNLVSILPFALALAATRRAFA
jgi:hypothetical protein